MTPSVAKWGVCDLCGGTEPAPSVGALAALPPAGWRRLGVPIVWVQSLALAGVEAHDTRTATVDACPACCVQLRAVFTLVQRLCSRRALEGAPAAPCPTLARPPVSSSVLPVVGPARQECRRG